MNELAVVLLFAPLVIGGAALWRLHGRTAERVAIVSLAASAVAGLLLAASALASAQGSAPHRFEAFQATVSVDALGAYVLAMVLVVALVAMAGSPRYVRHELASGAMPAHVDGRYYALFLWFVAALAAVPIVDNLGLVWVFIEATTVVSALLVGINRTPESIEAAWKYLILGTVGVGFALLATLLIYSSSVQVLGDSSDALNWTRLMSIAPGLNPALLRLAFVFALAGYGTKIGLAPFHTWLPDAHSQAPSPISAMLSGVSLVAGLYALVRFHLVASAGLGPDFSSNLLVGFGLLSLAVALPFLIRQEDVKRLLAYSSVEHMGLLTLGIGFGGPLALLGVTVHAGLHALTKSTLFLAAGELVQRYETRRLARLRGALEAAPVAGGALGIGILLLGGLPPSGMFVTEFAIVVGGVMRGYGIAAALAALLLALSFVALTVHGSRILWGRIPADVAATDRRVRGGAGMALRFGLPLAAVCLLGLWTPGPVATVFDSIRAILGAANG